MIVPSRLPHLADDEIHLWPMRLASCNENAGHAVLPWLGAYLGVSPADLRLGHGPFGKPALEGEHSRLSFSWSHTGEVALLGVAWELPELGVDIERDRPRPRLLDIAGRYFAVGETAWLAAQPPEDRQAAFLRLWTAKEAVLKAHGQGLSYGLHRVGFTWSGGPAASGFEGELAPASRWSLAEPAIGPGLHAHVAWSDAQRARRVLLPGGGEPLARMPV
ncbi:4'-phosphopantetheinyl transferase family protein [Pinirhizobacter sp.]|jgi:4'-phosphopantetheinyl transferase|uniref:4'-phosphopantetheinyl transferase family protein n=1 Tax=Pinirhizobacter sp. TaxID=2950432 RepID=UPI002F3F78EC